MEALGIISGLLFLFSWVAKQTGDGTSGQEYYIEALGGPRPLDYDEDFTMWHVKKGIRNHCIDERSQ